MKKGTQIQVSSEARYNGQDMSWTETFTGTEKIGNGGEWVFHSSNEKITSFRAKEICVSPYEYGKHLMKTNSKKKDVISRFYWKKFIYAIFLPEGFEVDTYSGDEYRFELTEGMRVVFLGTVYEAYLGSERVMTGSGLKEISKYIYYSDTIKL